jgi:hypothetical protein
MFIANKKISKIFESICLKMKYVPLIFLILLSSGCVAIKTNLKGMEPYARPIPIEAFDYNKIGDAEIMRSSFKLFWIFPVTPEPAINEAIDNTIIKTGGDNLIEMYTWHERQYWILGTVDIIHVKGSIIRYK